VFNKSSDFMQVELVAVYFLKHIDAILAIMTRPDLPVSEAPIGRFADALNYLELGWGLLSERESCGDPGLDGP